MERRCFSFREARISKLGIEREGAASAIGSSETKAAEPNCAAWSEELMLTVRAPLIGDTELRGGLGEKGLEGGL